MAKFSNELKNWRARKKLSQAGASKALGIPKRTIQNWEQEVSEPASWFVQYCRQAVFKR